ncbi:MAG: hypothetical protein M1828_003882 [Chrysothrix sp. TS-e1954]|nr:MAG: hypothetical protein M1828_003882 [Chrysothrix sp. TS-e1954]
MHINCPDLDPSADNGRWYDALGWTLQAIALVVVAIRLYSRLYLTRSAGSDDVVILLAVIVCLSGMSGETVAVHHGFGRHCSALTSSEFAVVLKWLYTDWLIAYIEFFLGLSIGIRTSVMLFTLRLLPRIKTRSAAVIYVVFCLNFATTLISAVSFGVGCRPFSALWDPQPGSKCISPSILSTIQKLNGILSAIIDLLTAMVPAFLLWKVQMKRTTKIILDTIFALGLITAGLSIGRAVTSPYSALTTDVTWRMMPANTLCNIEGKLGVILACGPSLRQLSAYYHRTGTFLPSNMRQSPNADFAWFRHRVNYRDFFWRGKRDPVRAQGLVNAEKRWPSTQTDGSASATTASFSKEIGVRKDVDVDPEDSPLDTMQAHVSHAMA